jgi:myo-inositol-1(or 4)-monophosphatase
VTDLELRRVAAAAVEVVQAAGTVVRRAWDGERRVTYKGSAVNLVTPVDREVEATVVAALRQRFPDHVVVGEETWDGRRPLPDEYAWYLDPIDGTTNFVHRYPYCAVSLALVKGDEYLVGVVLNPVSSELFVAYRGGGATLNGQAIHVSGTDTLERALVSVRPTYNRYAATLPSDEERAEGVRAFASVYDVARDVRNAGSAALDLCYAACGRLDGYWHRGLQPWDTAAGVLVLTEAGGLVTDWQGQAHGVWAASTLATNGRLHQPLQAVLRRYG